MNAVDLAQRAYGANAAPVRTNRSAEYAVFTRVTRNLMEAGRSGHGAFASLTRALYENRQLWATLAVDIAQDGNALPKPLRAQIFYLAEFVEQHSRKVLRGEVPVDALVDINTAVMRGLAGKGEQS